MRDRLPQPWAMLAPLTGLSDRPFRHIAHRYGADLVVTEMVAAAEYVRGRETARLKAEGHGIAPHVVQLVGCDPAAMGEAARIAEGSGADIVDINFGCPAKRVANGRLAGSALMRDPDHALAIVAAVRAATSRPVSVKMRLGWDDASRNAAELSRRAEGEGVEAVTIHGRTRQQFYKGQADWSAIRDVADAVRIAVTANGDVTDATEARRCLAQSDAGGVMIGRAAIGQPWIVGQIAAELRGSRRPAPSASERTAVATEHYEALLTLYGRQIGMRCARKHLAAYADRAAADGFAVQGPDRLELVTTSQPERVVALLARVFAEPMRLAA